MAATTAPSAATTSAPSAGTSGTPVAGLPSQFVRLSILLQSNLITGNQNGKITGVVITQPTASSGATATPTADQLVPYVRYVVVDFGGSMSNEMLLPFQMFSFSPAVSTANGVTQNFTLKGTAAMRNSAPRVSLPANTGALSSGWDSQASQYWASQGFSIPVTGTTSLPTGQDVLLRNTINGANIVDQKNQTLGQVSDFLLDPNTGQFEYAVFNGGQLFGNRLFIVPVRILIFQFSSATAAGLGNIQLNVPSTLLNAAPFITSLNQIPLSPALLQQFNTFWQNLQK